MSADRMHGETLFSPDDADRRILRLLQADATRPLEQIARAVGLSRTAVWNRIQRLQEHGVIVRHTIVVDPRKIGLSETFFVAIRTSRHNAEWLNRLQAVVAELPAATEVHRLAGEIDYLLKVQVGSTREFDEFYKQLVARIELFEVTSYLSMEVLKNDATLPI
jgi:Lrp/AsnC family transcriptional regulator